MTETTVAPPKPVVVEEGKPQKGWAGQNVPRKEDKRLLQGEGVFFDDIKRHEMGYVHFVRSPYAHARIKSVDVSKALELQGVYGTLTGDEVAILTDPFFELSVPPGAHMKDYALAVGKVRHLGEPVAAVVASTRELARDASELIEVEFEPLEPLVDARRAQDDGAPILHDEAGTNVVWEGLFDWGDWEAAKAEADHVVKIKELHFDRFSSTPLECSGCLVEYNRGTGQWTMYCNHQMPGVGAIWMAPAMRVGIDKLRFVTQDIGGGFGNKICLHPYFVACCLLARKLNRAVQWTEWRTDQHTANAHGNERWFQEIEVPVKADGTMLGFKVKAVDDCGAFPRYEPLGCIIWAQVTPGCYRWRNIRVDFTQVVTNKSPVSPNRGYSRMQHLWLTERIVDIVARELGLDPVEVRKRNYVKTEEMPYETPNGCIYDSGDYARCLDVVLELIGYDRIEERRRDAESRGKLLGFGIGSTLASGTNDVGHAQLPFMALGAILNANNAGLPEDLDVTLNCRYMYRPPFELPDKERKFGNLTLTYATQIHACVLEVDPETGGYEIVDYAAVDDCGKRIHPQIVEGQVHGATAQALGAATHEIFPYDEDGNLLTPNFYDYHVPHALDMPPMRTGYIESVSPFTPLGAKGMGEGGGAGIHAVCAALQDALGKTITRSCNPYHRVWELLRSEDGGVQVEGR